MAEQTPEQNRATTLRYFELMQNGDPELEQLFAEEIAWVAPQSSPVGRHHRGKAAVLELMSTGVNLYDMTQPMQVEIDSIAAEGDTVFVEMNMRATTGAGEPYHNHYVFTFRFRDAKIVEIHEHLDTLYAQRMLFDPVGQT